MRMPFEGKIQRAHKFGHEQRERRDQGMNLRDELTPSNVMEKGDGCAMLIAAFITLVPVALVVLAILAATGYFFSVR